MTEGTGLSPERQSTGGDTDAECTGGETVAGRERTDAAERDEVDEEIDRMVRTVDSMLERIEQLED